MPHRPALAAERVVHVGEAVAMIVAESALAAQDAAELVAVEYDALAPVTDARAALEPGAPQIWPQAPGNLAIDWPGPAGDPEANAREVDAIFAAAKFVARVAVTNQRMVVASIEPRGATASYDAAADSYTLRVCTQGAGAVRDVLVAIMGVPKERLRVLTDDVGGAFGLKTGPYPEYVAQLVAAKKLGRPIHWMSGRSEAFLSDNQARDLYSEAELALDGKGRFLALRIRNTANLGAYVGAVGANIPAWNFTRCLPGMYDIRHIDVSTRCVFTNTIATAPYRGAGRPEANYVLERVVEEAASMTGIDPVKLRRRNLIPAAAMPYKTAIGTTYDSGDFAPVLDKALALAGYDGFKARRRAAKSRGKYRGIGISCMLEHAGATPLEGAWLTFPGDGTLTVNLNVQSTGQGHASVFTRLVADRLGIGRDKITHKHGDSAREIAGYASVGSRSAMTAGAAIVKCVDVMLEKGKRIAAMLLEASEADIVYEAGSFGVVGTDRRIALFELAARAAELKTQGGITEDLDTKAATETPLTFPNGVPHRRGRNRSGHRPHGHHRLHRGRRLRQCARRHDRRGPAPWRGGARPRPGADGAGGLRRRRPARHRLVHGLRHAARRRHAADPRRASLRAGDHQPARRQGRRRSRHHGVDRRGDERGGRRHPRRCRRASRHAGERRAAVGGLPARAG